MQFFTRLVLQIKAMGIPLRGCQCQEEEVDGAADFIWRYRLQMAYFRHMPFDAVHRLCRIMGALACNAGHMVYDVKVRSAAIM